MSINDLHREVSSGGQPAEERLFAALLARFRLFARQRIWDGNDAEEVVQEALTIICRDYRSVEFTVSFSAWAYKVLDNRVLGYIQDRRRQTARGERLRSARTDSAAAVQDEEPDLKRRLLDCLRKLGERNRRYARIINLHYQGYRTEEICRRVAVTRSNLYSILSRARDLLSHCLERGEVP